MKICIDAGHYGYYNQSPAVKGYYESKMVWKLHLLLKKYLEEYGITVITTRANQENDLSLYTRGTKSKGCDLFISLHSNAVGAGVNEKIDYPVSYVQISGKADAIGRKLAECVHSVMGTSQDAMIQSRKGSSGGDYYGVLRGAASVGTVGLILEHSFHTNTKMTTWLMSDSNLEKLAKAEAGVIASHYGIKKNASASYVETPVVPSEPVKSDDRFMVRTKTEMNVRKGPGTMYAINCVAPVGTYTIVQTSVDKQWGKLLSGAGWIKITSKYAEKV